jgi:hypothetical protein
LTGGLYKDNFYGCLHSITVFYGERKNPVAFDSDAIGDFPNKNLQGPIL